MERIRVMLADDHPILREGLAALLQDESDMEVVGEAKDGHEAVRMATELRPDVFRAPSRGLGERPDFRRDYLKVETTHGVSFFLRRDRAAQLYDPDAVLVDLASGQRMKLRARPNAP